MRADAISCANPNRVVRIYFPFQLVPHAQNFFSYFSRVPFLPFSVPRLVKASLPAPAVRWRAGGAIDAGHNEVPAAIQ